MKNKLATLTILGTLAFLSTPNVFVQTSAALSNPDNLFDYSYTYNGGVGTYNFAVTGLNSYYVLHTRTLNGTLYDYTGTANGQGTPFAITHTFKKSTSSWMNYPNGTATYVPTGEYIGSSTASGTQVDKWQLDFKNDTANHYRWRLDFSTSGTATALYANGYIYANGTRGNQIVSNPSLTLNTNTTFLDFYVPAYTELVVGSLATSSARYMSSYYVYNLDIDDSVYDNIYDTGYGDGFVDGMEEGYRDANNMNQASNGLFDIMTSIFNAMATILAIEVLPAISLGTIVFIPIIFSLLMFIFKLIRGGN